MKRIIHHWTAGTHKANAVDIKAYHELFEGDGTNVLGTFPISANSSSKLVNGKLKSGTYAAHTLNLNTDSIGLSLCCMAKAIEGKSNGSFPMTEKQFEAMCKRSAKLCLDYKIPITPKTVLSHAEVQGTLGVKQKNKWDYTVLPFKPELKGAKACGDYMRTRVQAYYEALTAPVAKPVPSPIPVPKPQPTVSVQPEPKKSLWDRILIFFGVKK